MKYKAAILIISTKGFENKRVDKTAPLLKNCLNENDFITENIIILPDNKKLIKEKLKEFSLIYDLILTSGGTGLSPSDVTPEATLEVIDREIPGLAEHMRYKSREKTIHADLSRAICGQAGQSLIINLPGSPKGALENLGFILPTFKHAIDKIKGDPTDCQ